MDSAVYFSGCDVMGGCRRGGVGQTFRATICSQYQYGASDYLTTATSQPSKPNKHPGRHIYHTIRKRKEKKEKKKRSHVH